MVKRRGYRPSVGFVVLLALVAILVALLLPVYAYSGPGPGGGARSVARHLERYHAARPGLPIAAWSRTGAWWRGDERPVWIPDPPEALRSGPGRRSWVTIERDLHDATVEVAPGIVGRPWSAIGPDETVVILRDEGRTGGVTKSGRYVRL